MSTATAFKYYRPFPYCLASPFVPSGGWDQVTVSLAEAMAIYWNLETLSFTTTGTRGSADINWTNDIGPTESIAFTLTSSVRQGAYYDSSTPAKAPMARVCVTGLPEIAIRFDFRNSTDADRANVELRLLEEPGDPDSVRIYYRIRFSTAPSSTDRLLLVNPAQTPDFLLSGTPPSSGSFSILGVFFNWEGGGHDTTAWGSETVSASCTSAAFTY